MATVSDMLSDGKVPAGSSVKALSTSTTMPDWYTNYGMDILANQQALAAKPFQAYTDPTTGQPLQRFAGFTGDQEAGFEATRQGANVFRPELNLASQQTQNTFGRSGYSAAQPNFQQAGQYTAQSTTPTGLSMAQPFLGAAGQSSVSNIGQYMNPYTEQVANRIGQMGLRTLNEQLLPGISDRMIAAGQFGGTRQAELMGRALRDTMEGISAQQAQALQQGYGQALSTAGTDLSRQAQLAQTAGGLGFQQQGALAQAGQQMGALGQQMGTLYNADTANQLEAAQRMAAMAQQRQNQELTAAGALQQVGQQQQDLNQKNLDFARSEWERMQAYPQQQINAMQGALGAVAGAVPKTVEEVGIVPNATPTTSTTQDIISGLVAGAGAADVIAKLIK